MYKLKEYNAKARAYAEQEKDFATEEPEEFAKYVELLNQSLAE